MVAFDLAVRLVENGQQVYSGTVQMKLPDAVPAIEASRTMTDQFARGYHGIANPTHADLCNVMCNELFHLIRREPESDPRAYAFIAGSVLRLSAEPPTGATFKGLGRHPQDGETVRLEVLRRTTAGDERASHSCTFSGPPPAPGAA